MKKRLLPLAASLACSTFLLAAAPAAEADYLDTLELGISTGYRVDEVDWNIASDISGTATPNIVSELTWNDLEIYQVGGYGKIAVGNDLVNFLTYLRGHFNYGWITSGESIDRDFHGDDRTQEFSRSLSTTENDDVLDASIGLGFQWKLWQDRFTIAPLGGYSYHQQNLRDTNGVQLIPATGAFAGLDSTFETEWWGPWAGVDVEFFPWPAFSLFGSFEYHWAEYEAEANWNLRTDLLHPVSFRHEADDAEGYVLSLGGKYTWRERLAFKLQFDYQDWETDPGIIEFFEPTRTTVQRLNEANWESYALNFGISYLFY